ncbi:non-ribosomal peptide synthetase [Streptomyces chattanoogensis]|uniref:Phenyloxazoline synthase MbtB n=1 Tax=Streptomyces chattanoogensis TaxID=66876 RepID=A0A0N0GZQ0_9ACTN|nr:non-ribosomal peptide synthetase [Streptomyces chattanoogensis]KPC62700.1 peptide synthetase [Streptomyces chattanoogensis]
MPQDRGTAPIDLPRAVGTLLGLPAEDVDEHANLIELGLDSLRMMRLAGQWRRAGLDIGFADLAAEPTLAAWRKLTDRPHGDAGGPTPDPAQAVDVDESEPFELALMQHAYWVGRADGQQLGGVAAHFYHEFDGTDVDPARLEAAVRALFARHGMLRARILDDGRQRIAPESTWPGLRVHDLRALDAADAERRLAELRRCLSHRSMDIAAGEVFDIQLSLLPPAIRPGGTRLHVNLDMVVADALSLRVLLADLAALYARPDEPLPPLDYNYPRYLAERRAARTAPQRATTLAADRAYWHGRLPELPSAPQLPLAPGYTESAATTVVRRHRRLDAETVRRMEQSARRHGLTPAMALAAVFAETLTAFSAEPNFLLNLPLFDREPLDPQVASLVGDFTSSVLLAWDGAAPGSFAERAARLQNRFHADAAHSGHSGVEVLRDASRLHGRQVLAPVVYTSALGLGELFSEDVRACFGEASWIISQGPQVWLDAQVTEVDGGLLVNWDARKDAFAPGVLDAMFDGYAALLDRLLSDPDTWSAPVPPLLPAAQLDARAHANDTAGPRPGARLHEGFFSHAARKPAATALVWGTDGSLTYGELADRTLRLAARLRTQGVGPGDLVAITLPKGPDQITAVLGVLAAGAAYLPLGTDQPPVRRERIHHAAGVRLVLDDIAVPDGIEPLDAPAAGNDTDLAYVIYTSGSTGEPKGVELTHAAAMNTIDDLNERFSVGPADRTLALSALDFDLSVYDVFGPLSVGGAVVCVEEPARRDATVWAELLHRHRPTVVNCVPALLDMLITAAGHTAHEPALRLVLLGGDWIPLDLPGRTAAFAPGCRFVALGGTTETAIHSTICEVDEVPPHWRSVPYGTPLRNVECRVVDALGRDCPDWVPGELWIGGAGVARGYRGDSARTTDSFLEVDGLRWYRTGDRARYWPDGTLEFLGRTDHQVKVRGHRIELGEIEAALTAHAEVAHGVTVVGDDGRLAAGVTAAGSGVDVAGLRAFLTERLPAAMVPERIAVLPALPLSANGKVDRTTVRRATAAQEAAMPATPPSGEIERRAAAAWRDVLGVSEVGREHDFFALGGDSLLATRLVGRLRAEGFADIKLTELFAHPVLADFAAVLRLSDESAREHRLLVADPARRHEPFPLTDVQRAYWLGRDEGFTLGGIGCHFYREYDVVDLDVARLESAVNRLIERHEMLRAVFDAQGRQLILPEVPRYTVPVVDTGPDPEAAFADLRRSASHQVFDPASWPLFSLRGVRSGHRTRLAVGVDNIVLDALSILTFYAELGALYEDPDAELPSVGVTFRDYVLDAAPEPEALAAAQDYWAGQLPQLPPAPQLPLAIDPSAVEQPRFTRRESRIEAGPWQRIVDRARTHGLTPSAVLLSAFAEVLGRWSTRADLTLNLTLFDRKDVHPDINNVLGDFTSLMLVAYRPRPGESWLATARRTQEELWRALDHRDLSAVQVLRDLARHTGEPEVTMPVVFTSALGVGEAVTTAPRAPFAEPVWGVSQTPQVWLDHQVTEIDGGVRLNWDVVEELFPEGLVDAMFDGYLRLLEWLSSAEWDAPAPDLLPEAQRLTRTAVNATGTTPPDRLLHQDFFRLAGEQPQRTALVWDDGKQLTYGELADRALRLAAVLGAKGVRPGEAVAVTVPKGPDQVVAVLGVLAAGAAYLPVGVDQPRARRDRIHRLAGARYVVTDEVVQAASNRGDGVLPILIGDALSAEPAAGPAEVSPGRLAYVIFTSGSTGDPKGVEITHRAAVNTVADINERFGVGESDRVLAVSALDFDLSVYDIFGPLSAGGAVVLIEEESRRDAQRWLELVRRHRVTIWNTVPALLDMLLVVAEGAQAPDPLRLVLVSGDWVGLDLPGRLAAQRPACRFVALGGATEAAIWSNAFEVARVDPAWRAIPYGFPLRNQRFRVVDERGRDCPDWVAGELWIGGAGVAEGYRGAPDLTARQFVDADGGRWYRTGDLGRYWPDGTLEFLGRADHQVKIRGHRIELGEIEAALQDYEGVAHAVVSVAGAASGRRLVAAVVPATPTGENGALMASRLAESREPSADVLAARARAAQHESKAAEAVLAELLQLATLADGDAEGMSGLAARIGVADEHLPVVRLWLRWLVERKVLVEDAGAFGAGPKLPAALARQEPATVGLDDYGALVARAHRRLLDRLGDYREILAGRLDATVLLDDDVLAPANLADRDPGTAESVAEIARELAALAEAAGRPIEVVQLDGRDGRTAARLLARLGPGQVRYTLLDPAPAMVGAAAGRLGTLPHDTSCLRLRGTVVPDELRHRFDVVLADNVLHRYPDPARGPALAGLLARPGGVLLAVERTELTPVALLTAALLDHGYIDFDRERRQAGSPTLSGARWAELFARAGWHESGHRTVGASFSELVHARWPETAVPMDPVRLREHLTALLPAHMVPERIEVLPWLPLSTNGKVDRTAISALTCDDEAEAADEPPVGELERDIAALWAELLGLSGPSVLGRRRSFFELGGDSLLATRLITQLKQRYAVELPLRRIFSGPSLAQVAAAVAEEQERHGDIEEGAL